MGLGETSESSISLPPVQSGSLLTELFPKLPMVFLDGCRVSKSEDTYAWMKSSSSSSSSELKGGVLCKSEPKQGCRETSGPKWGYGGLSEREQGGGMVAVRKNRGKGVLFLISEFTNQVCLFFFLFKNQFF